MAPDERCYVPATAQLYAAGIGGAIFPAAFGGTPPERCDRNAALVLAFVAARH
jgi:hypothetical protein